MKELRERIIIALTQTHTHNRVLHGDDRGMDKRKMEGNRRTAQVGEKEGKV